MKFYNDNKISSYYWFKIKDNKLDAVYYYYYTIWFFKAGKRNNTRNAAYINDNRGLKQFYLNEIKYGNENSFTKQSWRKFVKLQAFI